MSEIVSHTSHLYHNIKPNGALIYSQLIVKYIIPKVKTNRNWFTINTNTCIDNSIVFIHSNVNLQKYEFLKKYKNLILVCSQRSTMYQMRKYGHAIYLPLAVDVDYIKSFMSPKTKDVCYAGRANKIFKNYVPKGVDMVENRTHPNMLETIAKYKKVYAVGITAIEAKILGAEILPYDPRFPDPSVWVVRDIRNSYIELQAKIDRIDNK